MFTGSRYKKNALAAASGAERTAREKKGADHRPRARQWPGYVRRGTGGASNCTIGSNYGPATTKSAQMGPARGFARWLLRDDPDRDDGIFSGRLSIPMVGLVGASEGKWVWRSGMHQKTGLVRASTWGWSWNGKHERPRVSARSDAAHRDARAPRPAPTHPTTRPGTYLDVPSHLERGARTR